jgi:hypothetical protein
MCPFETEIDRSTGVVGGSVFCLRARRENQLVLVWFAPNPFQNFRFSESCGEVVSALDTGIR